MNNPIYVNKKLKINHGPIFVEHLQRWRIFFILRFKGFKIQIFWKDLVDVWQSWDLLLKKPPKIKSENAIKNSYQNGCYRCFIFSLIQC